MNTQRGSSLPQTPRIPVPAPETDVTENGVSESERPQGTGSRLFIPLEDRSSIARVHRQAGSFTESQRRSQGRRWEQGVALPEYQQACSTGFTGRVSLGHLSVS